MKHIIYKQDERGSANYGWLNAKHYFSFGNWFDPNKIQFGALRVLNDDTIQPSSGFDTHPHQNMEIITIPLSGKVKHKDSTGGEGIINTGEIQVMSAGSGILHSEFNGSDEEELKLFQIWILPDKQNVIPRYDQTVIRDGWKDNEFNQLISPNKNDDGLWIHQNAWISMINMKEHQEVSYELKDAENGAFILAIDGEIDVNDLPLSQRDAVGIWETDNIRLKARTNTQVLIIDVPLNY